MVYLSRYFNYPLEYHIMVLQPHHKMVWAVPRSLATTKGIIKLFSFPPGTKMFQFPGFLLQRVCIDLRSNYLLK